MLYIVCFFTGLIGRLYSWLVTRLILFLGDTSYCLYLLHPDVGCKFINVGKVYFESQIL